MINRVCANATFVEGNAVELQVESEEFWLLVGSVYIRTFISVHIQYTYI